MIDPAVYTAASPAVYEHNQPGKKVLHMVKNDRMGGSVPSWDAPKTAQDGINERLTSALYTGGNTPAGGTMMALQASGYEEQGGGETFGFADLLDMVNPLQHIPIVGHLYRSITGDDIKPIGRIVGGGLFGGVVGAASGLVNIIAEEETGSDLTGNAVNALVHGKSPDFRRLGDDPQSALARAQKIAETAEKEPLPESLLAFTARAQPEAMASRIRQEGVSYAALENEFAPQDAVSANTIRTGIPLPGRAQKIAFREI